MTIEEIIEKVEEIQMIVSYMPEEDDSIKIYRICDDILVDYKIEKRLKDETGT